MKTVSTILFLLVAVIFNVNAQENIVAKNPEVITGHLVKVIPSLKDHSPVPLNNDIKVRDLNGIIRKKFNSRVADQEFGSLFNRDGALQKNTGNQTINNALINNFTGIGYQPLNPPDPTMCVGSNHIIQMINGSSGTLFRVYDKNGGILKATSYLDAITGKGGLGDPIALYDQLADRFVLTEFVNDAEAGSEGLVIAISQSGDPLGGWYSYFFSTGTTFPDYPKFSVWHDAYYATTNDFTAFYQGSTVYAFDRAKMLAGNPTATVQKLRLGSTSKHFSMCPVLLQGTTLPPSGTGGLIAYMQDDTWTGSSTDLDSIGLFEFKVNFTTPSLSTVSTKSTLATAAYISAICTATRGRCITQPGTTIQLEALHQKIYNQPIYRNFDGYEGIVLNHAVDRGGNIAGLRWYELRKTTGNWSMHQQSTYTPDGTHRFMGSVCYDKFGNIGLAYNVSSGVNGVYPGGRYTGRKECDPLNTMTYSETVMINGTGSNASSRYGDYNHLVADPDGIRFWFTCEYNAASTWSTRIGSFSLDPCVQPLCGDLTGLTSSNITNTSADVSWTAVANATGYEFQYKLSAEAWPVTPIATFATSVSLTGMTQGTLYDWRVRANCAEGSGNYIAAQFTTTAPATCGTVLNLTSSNISSTGATVSWDALTGANNYDVEYKIVTDLNWTNPPTTTTSTTVTWSGLVPATTYEWRVRANCPGATGAYSSAQFTTIDPNTCPDILEPNNSITTAAAIGTGTNYLAQIGFTGDNDYYSFNNNSSARNIRVTLTNLPADYDIRLYNKKNQQVGISQNGGVADETIIYNVGNNGGVGNYKVYVYGFNGAFSNAQCYTLNVQTSSTVFTNGSNQAERVRTGLKVYPVPASEAITVAFDAYAKGNASISIINSTGQQMLHKKVFVNDGINFNTIDLSKFSPGVYYLKVDNGKETRSQKIVVSK